MHAVDVKWQKEINDAGIFLYTDIDGGIRGKIVDNWRILIRKKRNPFKIILWRVKLYEEEQALHANDEARETDREIW